MAQPALPNNNNNNNQHNLNDAQNSDDILSGDDTKETPKGPDANLEFKKANKIHVEPKDYQNDNLFVPIDYANDLSSKKKDIKPPNTRISIKDHKDNHQKIDKILTEIDTIFTLCKLLEIYWPKIKAISNIAANKFYSIMEQGFYPLCFDAANNAIKSCKLNKTVMNYLIQYWFENEFHLTAAISQITKAIIAMAHNIKLSCVT